MKVRLADPYPAAANGRRPLFIDGSGRSVWLAQGADPTDDPDEDDEDGDSGTDEDADAKDTKDGEKEKTSDADALKKKLRLADKRAAEAEKLLRDAQDKDKGELEIVKRDLEEAKKTNESLISDNRDLTLVNGFLMVNEVQWHDNEDALEAAKRLKLLDDVLTEDGEVDKAKMKKALEALAKAKPHMVKKGKEEDAPGSTATHSVGTGGKGKGQPEHSREQLAKRYSALRR